MGLFRERYEVIPDMFGSTPLKVCFDSGKDNQASNEKKERSDSNAAQSIRRFLDNFRSDESQA